MYGRVPGGRAKGPLGLGAIPPLKMRVTERDIRELRESNLKNEARKIKIECSGQVRVAKTSRPGRPTLSLLELLTEPKETVPGVH